MKKTKKIIALMLAFCLIFGLSACGKTKAPKTDAPTVSDTPTEDTTSDNTADTTKEEEEKPQEQKPVILAVSFGTSYNETRDITIGAVEKALQTAYPDYEVRRAFTSQTIIDILKERDNLEIDNVTEAMARLIVDGVKEVIIQPTHVMPGAEYDDMIEEVSAYSEQFDFFKIGKPLLFKDADYDALVSCLKEETAEYNTEKTALVFMGHGTHHSANSTYASLQKKLHDNNLNNYFIGTVEATPSLEDVLALVKESGAKKVVLFPLMIVAGDHATNDMAGDEEDSWKTAFQNEGFEVTCVLKGLGEYKGVQDLIVSHTADAISSANPISASQIKDGTYEINVESSSTMFNIVKCILTVENGSMNAVITMSGDGYDKIFAGTGEEADAASESDFIPAVLDEEGAVTFAYPLEALNAEVDCAAWSIRKQKWYDRTLVFLSDTIPSEALTVEE